MTEFSGYFAGNHAADVNCDKGDEHEDCCCCLVCLQPAMEFISILFLYVALHPKYPGCSWTLQTWNFSLFIAHHMVYVTTVFYH